MRLFVFITAVIIVATTYSSCAQTKNIKSLEKFEGSIDRAISYPHSLLVQCIPTYAFIKISVNEQLKIDRLEISDTADKLLSVEFLSAQNKFDKAALEQYLIDNHLKNTDIIIPIIWTFDKYTCQPGSIPIEKIAHLTEFFNTLYIYKPAIFIKPLVITMGSVK